jgi:hypothetical protein
MRSPDEYEAAFYADTQNANPATPVRVGNHETSLQYTGGPSVRSIRKARKLSTQRLSDICSKRVGYAAPRNTIVNLETGRKESLSVQELVVIALALDTPPVVLRYPLDRDVEIAPDEPRNPPACH